MRKTPHRPHPEDITMKTANPYLNFAGNTEEAFEFYESVFGAKITDRLRFRDFSDNGMGVPDHELDKIAHIALPLGNGTLLMGTDVIGDWRPLNQGNNFYIALEADSGEEADTLFDRLSAGGQTEMPLQPTEWAEKYGSCVDRFGVQWMVMYTGVVKFAPAATT
jgi:PhnB protein